MPVKLKIFSIPRSGSNYTKHILERNFGGKIEIAQNVIAWKHAFIFADTIRKLKRRGYSVLLIEKSENALLESIYRYSQEDRDSFPKTNARSFHEFCNSPFVFWSCGDSCFEFQTPLHYIRFARRHYRDLAIRKFIIRYENLINDPRGTLERFARSFDLEMPKSPVLSERKRVRPSGEIINLSPLDFIPK